MDTLRLFLFFALVNVAAAYGGAALARAIGLFPVLVLALAVFVFGTFANAARARSRRAAPQSHEAVRCA